MKSNIFIGVLVAFCAVQVISASRFDTLIDSTIITSNVNAMVSSLKRVKKYIDVETNEQMTNLTWVKMYFVHDTVNALIVNISDAEVTAQNEGKNVSHCYDSAKRELYKISDDGISSVHVYGYSERQNLHKITETTGNTVLSEIETVHPACQSDDIKDVQECISQKLDKNKSSLALYRNELNDVITESFIPFENIISDVKSQIFNVRRSMNRCLWNAS